MCYFEMSILTDIALTLGLGTILILTIVGNVLVCLSVILVRKLRKPQNYLLVSLAVSDLFVALFVMPFAIIYEVNEAVWPLSFSLCDVWVSGDILLCTASILNLCAISVDRYRAITRPLEYSSVSSPRRMLSVIFVVWLLSACISLPPVLLLGNEYYTPNGLKACYPSQNYWYQLYATMGSFYLPLCVMVVVYMKILRVVSAKKKEMTWANSSRNSSLDRSTNTVNVDVQAQAHHPTYRLHRLNQPHFSKAKSHQPPQPPSSLPSRTPEHAASASTILLDQPIVYTGIKTGREKFVRQSSGRLKDHKASTTLGIIMSAFIICWLPFFALALIRPVFLQDYEIPSWVSSLFLWLGYANSALNPVIYATLNRDFRRPFREILCLRCSTLDDLMRKEFYEVQFGKDEQCIRRKRKAKEQQAQQSLEQSDFPTPLGLGNGVDDDAGTVSWSAI